MLLGRYSPAQPQVALGLVGVQPCSVQQPDGPGADEQRQKGKRHDRRSETQKNQLQKL
jgi:hypothetical protein